MSGSECWASTHVGSAAMGKAFQNCAEPGMAEPKRHMDVPQGACFGKPCLVGSSTKAGKSMSETLRRLLKEGKAPQHNTAITPHVGVLTLHFQLYGCEDLKAKRSEERR